ncbi:MAG: hypothetical protein QOF11_1220 [Chloroflexota bacterium]|nr:hypothetical protein [Chloroflexota bacterium]
MARASNLGAVAGRGDQADLSCQREAKRTAERADCRKGPKLSSRTPAQSRGEPPPPTIRRPSSVAIHPRLEALFGEFAADGLAWCLLRGEIELDGRAGDVDMLVDPGDLGRLRRAARAVGFVRLPARGYGSHLFLITYDPDSDRWIKLDVVTELAFGPSFAWRVADGASVLERTRRADAPNVWVLAEADAFWALLLHGLLDKGKLDDAQRARLTELAPHGRAGGPLARAIAPLLPEDLEPTWLVEAVALSQWEPLERLGAELAVGLRQRRRLDTARTRVDELATRRVHRLIRARRPRGLTVALVGDPLLVDRAAEELGATVPMPVRSMVFAARLRWPMRWLKKRPAPALRARLQRGTSLIVYRAGSLEDLPPRRGSLANLLSCPPPDLVILLDSSRPPTRAGEEPWISQAPGAGPGVAIVDARLPAGEVRRSIARLVWDRLADRWNALDRRSAEP